MPTTTPTLPTVEIDKIGRIAIVRFRYDERLVKLIRTVPGREWRSADRAWTVPAQQVGRTARLFMPHARVLLDGRPYELPDLREIFGRAHRAATEQL